MNATEKHIDEYVQRLDRELMFGLRDKENAMNAAIHEYHRSRYRVIKDILDLKGLVNDNVDKLSKDTISKVTTLRSYAKRMKAEDENSGINKLLNHVLEFDNVLLFDWLFDELGKDQYRTFMVLLRGAIDDGGPGKGTAL